MITIRTNKYAQLVSVDKLVTDWTNYSNQPGSIMITGTNANLTVNFNGQSLPIRPLIDNAVSLIRGTLIQKGVREIDTSPLPPNAQGLAVSSEPGKIHVDIDKIARNFTNNIKSPLIQTDGVNVDQDLKSRISDMISHEILGTISHESQHHEDFSNEFEKYNNNPHSGGPQFSNVQEAPGPQFENRMKDQYKSYFNI